jgi:hypothetical protein
MVTKIVAWRDSRAASPRGADIGVIVLRELMDFGRLGGAVLINVARGIPTLYRGGKRAEIISTEDDITKFIEIAEREEQPAQAALRDCTAGSGAECPSRAVARSRTQG